MKERHIGTAVAFLLSFLIPLESDWWTCVSNKETVKQSLEAPCL